MDEACLAGLLAACRLLFDRELDATFLDHLQESGLRAAWRRKALQTHPDRAVGQAAKDRQTERFIAARRAYGLLKTHLGCRAERRDPLAPPASRTSPGPHRPWRPPAPRPPAPGPSAPRADATRQKSPAPVSGVPRRRLRLGEFLYHSRVITFAALVETLVSQRRQRERFCEIALRWGYLRREQLNLLLAERLPLELIGETAQRLQLLSPPQIRLVLTFQRMRQEPLGSLFVRRGLLTNRRLEEQLSRMTRHNSSHPAG